ncbi:MAG: hypothetical protein KZQ66_02020 [Candidatus Thiodiazotropha sp. (ex Lucinoma aequizonata)]|nr:hypothetical protein [Candidatus Thiodiazotropha sp. (ex Lucinoma aequizonata)]MCU7889189.1 hypothetical protein [Candidatus Thiodiazotropha sp. (ex Lucinoma aequizonata)]MCU7895128.1 hypothetical protein [Candidatus Thiodiazotropha sp. (ex Lucinoma aequizonata)]MCU7900498.1 hypothetical protein [Candidatus Thiodiazotropha sp. (ex Lucinoma aequizonata)]MCU7900936.1 hypothetical protein [Candidatus Thiodiazotropha sp. (ex Lucinoma aequizonata)]
MYGGKQLAVIFQNSDMDAAQTLSAVECAVGTLEKDDRQPQDARTIRSVSGRTLDKQNMRVTDLDE